MVKLSEKATWNLKKLLVSSDQQMRLHWIVMKQKNFLGNNQTPEGQ